MDDLRVPLCWETPYSLLCMRCVHVENGVEVTIRSIHVLFFCSKSGQNRDSLPSSKLTRHGTHWKTHIFFCFRWGSPRVFHIYPRCSMIHVWNIHLQLGHVAGKCRWVFHTWSMWVILSLPHHWRCQIFCCPEWEVACPKPQPEAERRAASNNDGGNHWWGNKRYMGGSWNGGTPWSSILMGFSIMNHPVLGTPCMGPQMMRIQIYLSERIHLWMGGDPL